MGTHGRAFENSPQVSATKPLVEDGARLGRVLAHSPTVVYSREPEADFRINFVSSNAAARFGYESAEIVADPDIWLSNVHPDDAERVETEFSAKLCDGSSVCEYRVRLPCGVYRWVRDETHVVRDANGHISEIAGSWTDITEQREVEAALRESEARFRDIAETAPGTIVVTGFADGEFLFANEQFEEMSGYRRDELGQVRAADFYADKHARQRLVEAARTGPVRNMEFRLKTRDGETRWALLSSRRFEFRGKDALLTSVTDVDDQKKAAAAMRESEERYRRLSEITKEAVFVMADGKIVDVNRAAVELVGYPETELLGFSPLDVTDPAFHDMVRDKVRTNFEGTYESRARHRDGSTFPVSVTSTNYDIAGRHIRVACLRDISQEKAAERALRESEERYRSILENMTDGFYRADRDGLVTMASPSASEFLGYSTDEVIGLDIAGLYVEKDGREKFLAALQDAGGKITGFEARLRHRDGHEIWVSSSAHFVRDAHGDVSGVEGTIRDITDHRRAEIALRENEERFRAVVENSPSALLLKDSDGRIRMMNRRFQAWFELSDDAIGKTTHEIYPKDVADGFVAHDSEVMRTGVTVEQEYEVTFADGKAHTVVLTKFPVVAGAGKTIGIGTIGTDVTEQRRTEEQLRQAQKMEAVGQLTGGVAHDFNNLLAVIRGNLELIEDTLADDSELSRGLSQAMRATDRAADLTQRLLAFSRRQTLQPRIVDLNDLVAGMGEIFRRALGETIEVRTVSSGTLWPCEVDPSQMENALLNLAINARDAMPDGGKLTIETGNVSLDDQYAAAQADVLAGGYVQIAVSDTGIGMSPDVASRAFEPFFSTKEVGKGSGLGLSMIYGFVKQSGGYVKIYSEEGKGTTVRMYLPRSANKGSGAERSSESENESPKGQGETILIVEDDSDVRTLAVILLRNLGYQTVDARSGAEALELLTAGFHVDLMLTDVVLPGGMNGRELADEVRRHRRGLPIVFMSGYTQDAIVHHGRLDEGVNLLQKPFRKHELAAKVRRALGPHDQ